MVKNIAAILFSLLIFNNAHAGLNGITVHSRANCVNNESITWDATHAWNFFTTSDHLTSAGVMVHSFATGWQTTRRSAAVHWGEGHGGWIVTGHHWINNMGKVFDIGEETVVDCSLYDGWWDPF